MEMNKKISGLAWFRTRAFWMGFLIFLVILNLFLVFSIFRAREKLILLKNNEKILSARIDELIINAGLSPREIKELKKNKSLPTPGVDKVNNKISFLRSGKCGARSVMRRMRIRTTSALLAGLTSV
jgi:hypothetical protein